MHECRVGRGAFALLPGRDSRGHYVLRLLLSWIVWMNEVRRRLPVHEHSRDEFADRVKSLRESPHA